MNKISFNAGVYAVIYILSQYYWLDECFIFKWINSVDALMMSLINAWFIHISSLNHFSWEGYPLRLRIKDGLNMVLIKNFKNHRIEVTDDWTHINFRISQINNSWNTNPNFIYRLQQILWVLWVYYSFLRNLDIRDDFKNWIILRMLWKNSYFFNVSVTASFQIINQSAEFTKLWSDLKRMNLTHFKIGSLL